MINNLAQLQGEFYKMQLEKQKVQAELDLEHYKLHAELLRTPVYNYPMNTHEVEVEFDGD